MSFLNTRRRSGSGRLSLPARAPPPLKPLRAPSPQNSPRYDVEQVVEGKVVHGSLIDFLIRLCPAASKKTSNSGERLLSHYMQHATEERIEQSSRANVAAEIVEHEILYSSILVDLTSFWKKQGEWVNEPNLLKNKIREVWKIKQRSKCLHIEVENWMLRHTLRSVKEDAPVETHNERRERHQDFWAQFHEVPRACDLSKLSTCENAFDQDAETLLEEQKRGGRHLQWKTRPARSRCSAGAWDWSRSSSRPASAVSKDRPSTAGEVRRDKSSSSFARKHVDVAKASRMESTTKTNISHKWWQEHCPEVCRATGSRSASFAAGRSLSLPNLTKASTTSTTSVAVKKEPLPASNAFVFPSRGRITRPQSRCEETTTAKRYLSAVQAIGVLPKPIPFCTGHSLKFTANGQSMSDKDLIAIVDMMPAMPVEEVDLRDNTALSEKPMMKLFETMAPTARSLQQLSLRRCVNAGHKVIDVVTTLMNDFKHGCCRLKSLDLSGVPIGARRHLPLAKAIGTHPALATVAIADIDLGSSPHPVQCVHAIMHSQTITCLDLGWNFFSEEAFSTLGEGLVEMQSLKSLSLVNCSSTGQIGHATPIVFFIEQLNYSNALEKLDISLNRIDFRAALVLEDALESRKSLTELNVSQNPLGFLGMRSILRLLSRGTSGLQYFHCNGCSIGKASDQSELYQVFSFTNPGGRYTLELTRPYHRSILRMLYKTCDRYALTPDTAFADIKASPRYSHASKGDGGIWMVPTNGTLSATFSIDAAVDRIFKDIDPWEFGTFVEKYVSLTRVHLAFNKTAPLLAQWKTFDGHVSEQRTFLRALSADFLLEYPHIEQMALNRAILPETIGQLMSCMQGSHLTQHLTMLLLPSLGDFLTLLDKQQAFLHLNVENPNGHYEFELENSADRTAAERLLLLDRWETVIARRLHRTDTSQNGNHSQIRNEKFQKRPLGVLNIQEWNMPECDDLEFDYSSGKRPPPDASVLDDVTFSNILVMLQKSNCDHKAQLKALQMASHMIYLKAVQMRGLLGIYVDQEARVDLFVLFFLRVVDFYNEKIYRVRFEEQKELDLLSERLGYVTLLPFIQPEQTRFCLDFSVYEQRLAANIIISLGAQERPDNLREVSFINEKGIPDKLQSGLPRSWEHLEKMPKGGKLTVSYVCSPEDRKYKARRKFYEMYGFRLGVSEDRVMWWAALNEAPEDVLEYLSFLVAKYDSLASAFREIDGPGGNGVISLREFEEGYTNMQCKKFQGANDLPDMQRIHAVFRYLDPSGEGQVSMDEWNILDLLWKEIQLSITEFIQFCERTFGDNLEDTWAHMDEDQGGEIALNEWMTACKTFGYFGPVKPIFEFLDADDEGTICVNEFKQLERFQEAPENRFRAKQRKHTFRRSKLNGSPSAQ